MQANAFFEILLLLVASFAWTQKLEYNFMIEDHFTDPYLSYEVAEQQRIDNRSHLLIDLKEEGRANISWNGAENNMKSLVIIYMNFPNKTHNILMKTIEVPRGIYTIEYIFEYSATYIVRLLKRSWYDDGLYINVVNQTFYNENGIDSQINFKRENCTGGLLTWPAFSNVTSYQITILNHRDTGTYRELITTMAGNSSSHRHKFKIPDYFEMEVIYNFQHTPKTLVLKRTLSIGRETCPKYENVFYNDNMVINLKCLVMEEDKKCYKRISLTIHKYVHFLSLSYDKEKKCFFDPEKSVVASGYEGSGVVSSQDWASFKLKYVADENGCVNFFKSFNYDTREIMKKVESLDP